MNTCMEKEKEKEESCNNHDKWGYVVCFGTVITFIAGIGHVNSFGLIYKDFIIETHSNAKSLTTAHGVFAVMLAVGGLILNVMSKRYPLRFGGYIGAFLMTSGSFLTIMITNTNQLPLTFGLLQGVGFGMMVPVCYSTLNRYFVEKRTQVMSLIKATQGVLLICYPQLIKVILSFYGFKSTLLLISGTSLHTFPGMATMTDENKRTASIFVLFKSVLLLYVYYNFFIIVDCRLKENGAKYESSDLLSDRTVDGAADLHETSDKPKTNLGNELLDILNVKILKDLIFCNICIGQSFVNFSDLIFFILQPMLLFQYGFDTNQVAACISISAGADVAGRFALALISGVVPINTRLLFFVATLFTLTARIVILQVRQFVWVASVTSVLGVLRAWLHVCSPLVISDHVAHQEFTGAYALFMLSTGIVNVVFSPIIGLLKDLYQDYIPAFYALTVCCLPCLVFWPVEYFSSKNKKIESDLNGSI